MLMYESYRCINQRSIQKLVLCYAFNITQKGEHIMMEIHKDMLIGDIIRINESAADILMEWGMGCMGCPASQAETLEDACLVHGLQVDDILASLNQ